jgi:hypothetical protein
MSTTLKLANCMHALSFFLQLLSTLIASSMSGIRHMHFLSYIYMPEIADLSTCISNIRIWLFYEISPFSGTREAHTTCGGAELSAARRDENNFYSL